MTTLNRQKTTHRTLWTLRLLVVSVLVFWLAGCGTRTVKVPQISQDVPPKNLLTDCHVSPPPSQAALANPIQELPEMQGLRVTEALVWEARALMLGKSNIQVYQDVTQCNKKKAALRDYYRQRDLLEGAP